MPAKRQRSTAEVEPASRADLSNGATGAKDIPFLSLEVDHKRDETTPQEESFILWNTDVVGAIHKWTNREPRKSDNVISASNWCRWKHERRPKGIETRFHPVGNGPSSWMSTAWWYRLVPLLQDASRVEIDAIEVPGVQTVSTTPTTPPKSTPTSSTARWTIRLYRGSGKSSDEQLFYEMQLEGAEQLLWNG